MKGIVLAGGSGKRLHPITKVVNKQLLPIYNKPMIYYPISTLMLAGIRDILIITTPEDISKYQELLGHGGNLGLNFSYKVQPKPEGLAQAFIIGEEFIGNDDVCLILGDNIFYGKTIPKLLRGISSEIKCSDHSIIFGYPVKDPERYGVVEFDQKNNALSIEEKPASPKSKYAVVGLYFYKNDVINISKKIKPSKRGELEITSVNQEYLRKNRLKVKILDSIFWLDTGTHDALSEASNFIKTIENREGRKVSCLEEIAFKYNYINLKQLNEISLDQSLEDRRYLKSLIKRDL